MNKIITFIISCAFLFASSLSAKEFEDTYSGRTLTTESNTYTIEKKLGSGAYGAVYLAKNEQEESIAVKIFTEGPRGYFITKSWPFSDMLLEWQAIPKFREWMSADNEWENGNLLNHPNIIRALDRGKGALESSEKPFEFIVFEYIDGETVGGLEDTTLSRTDSLRLTIQFLDALSYASTLNRYYSDLHPFNVMVDKDRVLKVIDVGSFMPIEIMGEGGFALTRYFLIHYNIIKTLLSKSHYTKEELKGLGALLKEKVEKVKGTKVNEHGTALYQQVLQEWINILQQELENQEAIQKAA